MPIPTALLIAFAIFRWLTGRSPVILAGLIRPISVMYSDMMEKFCGSGQFGRLGNVAISP